ncbi:MAG: tetratricopeptide repeat protein [Woeseiaceae bacterium]
MRIAQVLLGFMILGLTGCSLVSPPTFESPPQPPATESVPAGSPAQPDVAPAPQPLNPAAEEMIRTAEAQRRAGDFARAGASLERALRIAPGHPAPWLAMAQLRLAEGDLVQSENLARRSLNRATSGTDAALAAQALLARIQSMPR